MITIKELEAREKLNIPTQDYLLRFMRDIGLNDEQIEKNRAYNHGQLYLSPGIVLGAMRGEVFGRRMNIETGELIAEGNE